MKIVTSRDYPKYFASIYDRLHFVRKEAELFLYDIEGEAIALEAYSLAYYYALKGF